LLRTTSNQGQTTFLLFDVKAPIVPGQGLGGVLIGSHIGRSLPILITSDLDGFVTNVTATKGYEGLLFDTIRIGMSVGAAKRFRPDIRYDPVDQVLLFGVPGVFFCPLTESPLESELDDEEPICEITVEKLP
jgi:hypothetical protein